MPLQTIKDHTVLELSDLPSCPLLTASLALFHLKKLPRERTLLWLYQPSVLWHLITPLSDTFKPSSTLYISYSVRNGPMDSGRPCLVPSSLFVGLAAFTIAAPLREAYSPESQQCPRSQVSTLTLPPAIESSLVGHSTVFSLSRFGGRCSIPRRMRMNLGFSCQTFSSLV